MPRKSGSDFAREPLGISTSTHFSCALDRNTLFLNTVTPKKGHSLCFKSVAKAGGFLMSRFEGLELGNAQDLKVSLDCTPVLEAAASAQDHVC